MKSIRQLREYIKRYYGDDYRWLYLTSSDPDYQKDFAMPDFERAREVAEMVEPNGEHGWFDPVGEHYHAEIGTIVKANHLIYLGRIDEQTGVIGYYWGTTNGEIIKGTQSGICQISFFYYRILTLVSDDGEEVLFDKKCLPEDE